MATYTVLIERTGVDEGKLTYAGNINHECKCWWDPKDKILAGTYTGCSKTYLASKKNSKGKPREGIFIPNVPNGKGGLRTGIFIHYWPGPGANLSVWSDGCAVVLETDMLKIWDDIATKDGKNVTVTVKDAAKK